MRITKIAIASAIIFLFVDQFAFAQIEKNKDTSMNGACPTKIDNTPDGRQGMKQVWSALRGCLSGRGYIGIDELKNRWLIDYRNNISLVGGVRIADYEGELLSLRIENSKTSVDESQDWSKDQLGVGAVESVRSVLNISVKKNMSALTVAAIERDLDQLDFKKIATAPIRPGMEIFIKNYGLTRVTVYFNEAVESAPEVTSLRLDGYK